MLDIDGKLIKDSQGKFLNFLTASRIKSVIISVFSVAAKPPLNMAKVFFAGVINNLYIITASYPNYGYGIDQAELYRYNNDRTLKPPYHRQ